MKNVAWGLLGDTTSRAIKHLDVPYANSGRLTNHHCEKLLYLESIAVKSTSFLAFIGLNRTLDPINT
jgi:hypothetical protein